MEGTVLKDGMDSVWEMLVGNLKPSDRVKFQQLDQKIRYSGFGRKNYSEQNEVLKELLGGLINNRKVQILHYSHRVKRERYHIVHPYTILLHRDSLYLSAYDEEYEDIRTFLIDRIKDTVLKNEKFRCRVNFNVDNLTDGSFGVYKSNGDKAVKVRVRFKEILWEYLTTRKWHRSQKFSKVKDREFTMHIELRNMDEFVPWILQFGSDAEVLKPKSLRERVKRELMTAVENY